MRRLLVPVLAFAVPVLGGAGCSGGPVPFDEAAWSEGEEAYRQRVEETLTSDDSWLTVAGLHFLTVGEHVVGSDPAADLRIPERFPAKAVTVEWTAEGKAFGRVSDELEATVGGEPFREGELALGEEAALVLDDRVRFWLHHSGDRRALRLRDLDHSLRRDFTGRKWFPLDRRFRVEAAFDRYSEERAIEAINIRGDIEPYVSHGEAVFDLDGQETRMQAFTRANGNLFFIFTDGTSGVETYPSARFLTASPPEGGRVIVDFNRAVNPPCGFSPYTTCPTPPPQNPAPFSGRGGGAALPRDARADGRLTGRSGSPRCRIAIPNRGRRNRNRSRPGGRGSGARPVRRAGTQPGTLGALRGC